MGQPERRCLHHALAVRITPVYAILQPDPDETHGSIGETSANPQASCRYRPAATSVADPSLQSACKSELQIGSISEAGTTSFLSLDNLQKGFPHHSPIQRCSPGGLLIQMSTGTCSWPNSSKPPITSWKKSCHGWGMRDIRYLRLKGSESLASSSASSKFSS